MPTQSQQCTRFRTTLHFDREHLWNGLSNPQAENGVTNTVNFGPLTTELTRIMFTNQNSTENHRPLGGAAPSNFCTC